ncbi:MAG: CHASE3 domain-containing protein [Burkholderiaceae bacterium]
MRSGSSAARKNTPAVPLYIVVLFVVCLLTLGGSALISYQNLQRLKENNDWMEHSWRVTNRLKNVNLLVMDAEASLRGYYLTGNAAYRGPWKTAESELAAEFAALDALFANNPAQQENLAQLKQLLERKMKRFEQNNLLYEERGLNALIDSVKEGEGRETLDEIRLLEVIMEKEERELLTARRNRFYENYNHSLWAGNVINAIAVLVLILFFRLIQSGFQKRHAVENALQAANEGLETTVAARTEELAVLSRHLLKVAEEEKARLARELHDELGAHLTTTSMQLSMALEKLKGDNSEATQRLVAQLEKVRQGLREAFNLKRRVIEDLRPSMIDNLGLSAAIQNHYEDTTKMAGLALDLDIAEDFPAVDPALSIALYRIAQESLTNIVKYARASTVRLTLACRDGRIRMRIADDGIGIGSEALKKTRTHGLVGMRERAHLVGGRLTVQRGADGHGTVVEVTLPLDVPAPAGEAVSA